MKEEAASSKFANGNTVHRLLRGKGGVGKSLIANILAQYLMSRRNSVRCTNPVNRVLTQYQALDAQPLKLLGEGGIDQRGFDALIEVILTSKGIFVVDNRASTFIPLWNYILENNVGSLSRQGGKRLCIHTMITAARHWATP